jgi:pimeloyl-ACP methyl ester carboxylesterase
VSEILKRYITYPETLLKPRFIERCIYMNNVRVYGTSPINVVVVHGGPGAKGDLQPLAQELSNIFGVLEPLQTLSSINELVEELRKQIVQHAIPPISLIGHSWGAWLSIIFSVKYPELVRKIILIGSAPFEESYAKDIMKTRLERLNQQDRTLAMSLQTELLKASNKKILKQFGSLISKADTFDMLDYDYDLEFNVEQFQIIWEEAKKLRSTRKLLEYTEYIKCPLFVIHGDFDPHPYQGVVKPLLKTVKDFNYKILQNCGHSPWKERIAHREFYNILQQEIKS